MALLANAKLLSKSFGSQTLFRNVSLTISDGDRLGLIGPNGAGKSTLLAILAGRTEPDSGEVALRKRARMSVVAQDSQFAAGLTVEQVLEAALDRAGTPVEDRDAIRSSTLGRAGFERFDTEANSLSGGWRKRLAIAEAMVEQPDLLLLDEPTNHLDLEAIEWLEGLLKEAPFASVIVSHDRYFLENVTTSMAELSRVYPDGIFRAEGNYSAFLERKAEFVHAQSKQQEALENRVQTEIEWLRRGPKARTTKSKARIAQAHDLMDELADLTARTRSSSAGIDFTASERKTKRLIELENVEQAMGGRTLFANLNFALMAGTRVGLVGPNGSGKTTLLRLLTGELPPAAGTIRRADALRVVYFDQQRRLDPEQSLRRALAPEGDSVIYRDRVIHVAAWAARFLFPNEQLVQPVGSLSGGERARVLIARLMLEPADVLLLDEPTNDLDIPTLEILEESLSDFPGALVLVTHDRYLLDRVSTVVLGLDGEGGVERFADYSQWETWRTERARPRAEKPVAKAETATASSTAPSAAKKKLSYKEAREWETIEKRIADAEALREAAEASLNDPAIASDGAALQAAAAKLAGAAAAVDSLYERWAELEAKQQ